MIYLDFFLVEEKKLTRKMYFKQQAPRNFRDEVENEIYMSVNGFHLITAQHTEYVYAPFLPCINFTLFISNSFHLLMTEYEIPFFQFTMKNDNIYTLFFAVVDYIFHF